MINGKDLLDAVNEIASEKKIDKEIIFTGIREGFQKSFERFFDTEAVISVEIDEDAGTIKVFQNLNVVKEVEDDWLEITPTDAKKELKIDVKVGDVVKKEVKFNSEFSRLAIQQVRQIIQQKIRGAERENTYSKFIDKVGEIIFGKITGMNEQGNSYLVDIDGTQASIWNQKIIFGEKFDINQIVSFFVEDVLKDAKFSQIMLSRTAPDFLTKLLEIHVPEISEGLVEVKAVSREPGKRAKVAVYSNDSNIDPVGSVVGAGGSRIKTISKELQGEQIDVIEWNADQKQFIINAMAPVKVISIDIDEENNECDIVVPNEQLSLAIGKMGMAARLVANLVKMRVNIYSLDNAKIDELNILWNGNITEKELSDPVFLENINQRRQKAQRAAKNNLSHKLSNGFDIDLEALEEFQNEIRAEQDAMSAEEQAIDEMLDEQAKDAINIDEINANLEALAEVELNDLEVDEETETDELNDEYDEYYDEK